MFTLNNLKPALNSRKKSKRKGRGDSSGKGSFSGKGCKGQNARTGAKFNPLFEGGQTPLVRRMPKKRFTAINKKEYFVINVSYLDKLALKGFKEINKELLIKEGILRKKDAFIKLLGDGEIKSKVNVTVDATSKQAIEKVEKAGGKVEIFGKKHIEIKKETKVEENAVIEDKIEKIEEIKKEEKIKEKKTQKKEVKTEKTVKKTKSPSKKSEK
ncbi:50S ribosomal protein L15 [Candidatus Gracilibacteria bacterium]|nr:50S ribosomal protein L15 [Candidatus Gracilibacteria bacterium]